MGYDLGSYFANAGKGILEGLTGIKQDGFYRNTYDPDTNQLFGVDSNGKRFPIPRDQWTSEQAALVAERERKADKADIKKDVAEATDRQFRNLLTLDAARQKPALAQIESANAIAQGNLALGRETLTANTQAADADRAARLQSEANNNRLQAQALGIRSDEAKSSLYLGEKRLALEAQNLENANIARINQQTLDQHATKMQSIQSAIALMARGLAGAF